MKKWHGFAISLFIIALDQLSKHWVLQHLTPYQPMSIIPMFNLMLAFNSGSAFSFLSDSGEWHRWFFMGFSACMSLVFIIWMIRLPARSKMQLVSLALILGGAVGNLIDRVLLGHVIDFIDLYYATYHWPAFNIADGAICVGAILLVFNL